MVKPANTSTAPRTNLKPNASAKPTTQSDKPATANMAPRIELNIRLFSIRGNRDCRRSCAVLTAASSCSSARLPSSFVSTRRACQRAQTARTRCLLCLGAASPKASGAPILVYWGDWRVADARAEDARCIATQLKLLLHPPGNFRHDAAPQRPLRRRADCQQRVHDEVLWARRSSHVSLLIVSAARSVRSSLTSPLPRRGGGRSVCGHRAASRGTHRRGAPRRSQRTRRDRRRMAVNSPRSARPPSVPRTHCP